VTATRPAPGSGHAGAGILDLWRAHGLKVVEDAAHAFPAREGDKMVGSLGDATCFSFYANKTITTAEGGMLCPAHRGLGAGLKGRHTTAPIPLPHARTDGLKRHVDARAKEGRRPGDSKPRAKPWVNHRHAKTPRPERPIQHISLSAMSKDCHAIGIRHNGDGGPLEETSWLRPSQQSTWTPTSSPFSSTREGMYVQSTNTSSPWTGGPTSDMVFAFSPPRS